MQCITMLEVRIIYTNVIPSIPSLRDSGDSFISLVIRSPSAFMLQSFIIPFIKRVIPLLSLRRSTLQELRVTTNYTQGILPLVVDFVMVFKFTIIIKGILNDTDANTLLS